MKTDLTVEQFKIPASKQIKCSLSTNWILPTPLCEAPHLYRRWPSQSAHHNHCLLSDFLSSLTCTTNAHMHMSQDHRQSSLKALLNTFGMCHKMHTMTTRYESCDTEDIPASQDSDPLDLAPLEHTVCRRGNESSDEYHEETDTHHPWLNL